MKTRNVWMGTALLLSALLLSACGGDSGGTTPAPAPAPTPAPTPPPPPPSEPEPEIPTATYIINAVAEESYSSNPQFQTFGFKPFPQGAGGVDPIAVLAHPAGIAPWEDGGMASPGLKTLAETGDSAALIAEGEEMGFSVIASSFGEIAGLVVATILNPDNVEGITISQDQPCLTYVQRLEPSPDWFIVVTGVCAVDDEGNWIDELPLAVLMYDAGTAEGEPYMDATGPTSPQQSIRRVELPPWDANAVTTLTVTRLQE